MQRAWKMVGATKSKRVSIKSINAYEAISTYEDVSHGRVSVHGPTGSRTLKCSVQGITPTKVT